jgi:hypothetical protein
MAPMGSIKSHFVEGC